MEKKTVRDFKNYDFENLDVPEKYWGDYTDANYFKGEFLPIAEKEMKSIARLIGAELVEFNPMHFEYSAFLKKDNKFIYVSVGDVRYSKNWYDCVLYRSAKNEKDYSGGSNNYCSYNELGEKMLKMFNRGW